MKVKSLISALQKKDPEADVLMLLPDNGSIYIQHVEHVSNSEYIEIDFEIELIENTNPCVILSYDDE